MMEVIGKHLILTYGATKYVWNIKKSMTGPGKLWTCSHQIYAWMLHMVPYWNSQKLPSIDTNTWKWQEVTAWQTRTFLIIMEVTGKGGVRSVINDWFLLFKKILHLKKADVYYMSYCRHLWWLHYDDSLYRELQLVVNVYYYTTSTH